MEDLSMEQKGAEEWRIRGDGGGGTRKCWRYLEMGTRE